MAVNVVEKVDGPVPVRHALVSVSNKGGLENFVPALVECCDKLMIYSTGGTYASLEKVLGQKARQHLMQVADYTGQPEMQGGLVKTLDFKIYLGLLSETHNPEHTADLQRTHAVAIDLVVVNLYPFRETIARPGVSPEEARANIDIGGPCMIRAAAKNFLRVAPVVDPADYPKILDELKKSKGKISLETRYNLARKAFEHTAEYDRAIANYLTKTEFAAVEKAYPEIMKRK
jgi:phosphoribosylaminoimidazolecarboxamide formyltransferase / IMP cyclohydrolase